MTVEVEVTEHKHKGQKPEQRMHSPSLQRPKDRAKKPTHRAPKTQTIGTKPKVRNKNLLPYRKQGLGPKSRTHNLKPKV